MKSPISIAALVLLVSVARADTVDDRIVAAMKAQGVPAVSIAVVKSGKIVRLRSYGVANLEWNAPATNDTRYEIASMSKMFIGASILMLADEGKLSLEDPVSKYFPDAPSAWSAMKIRHLATMSSGLPEDFASDLVPYNQEVATLYTDETMRKAFYGLKPVAPIGRRFEYSGPNFAMLGMIVSKASGEPYSQFVKEHIFDPAEMRETTYIDNSAVLPHRAEGYRHKGGKLLRGWFLGQYLHKRADVGILSTARDVAKFIIALESAKLVRQPDRLWQYTISDDGLPLDYSFGWFASTRLGEPIFDHAGGYRTGFHTYTVRYPQDNVSLVVMSNCDFSPVRDYAIMAAAPYLHPPFDPLGPSVRDPDPDRTQRVANALNKIAHGKTDDLIPLSAFGAVPISDVRDILSSAKNWEYVNESKTRPGLQMHGVALTDFFTLRCMAGTDRMVFSFYRDGSGNVRWVELTN